jgi:hypothetical protein
MFKQSACLCVKCCTLLRLRQKAKRRHQIEARSCDKCCSGKAIIITYSQCVFLAVIIQHAVRMRRIVLSFVYCLVLLYSSTLSHKRHDFRKQLNIFFFLRKVFLKHFLILRRTEWGMIKNVYWSSCTVSDILVTFKLRFELFRQIFEK